LQIIHHVNNSSLRAVVQRVSKAEVAIEEHLTGRIGAGLVVLLGISIGDTEEDVDWLAKKILGMRIFGDQEGKMNLSIHDINGAILIISQFTLHASTKKGNRPSFIKAAKPDISLPLYHHFIQRCKEAIGSDRVATGSFGAEMDVSLTNQGPVTIIIDSKNKE